MNETANTLPDNLDELREISSSLLIKVCSLQTEDTSLQEEKTRLQNKIEFLHAQIRLMIAKRFGRSSEKFVPPNAPSLFDEADLPPVEPKEEEQIIPQVTVPGHVRGKPRRAPLPEMLPRVEVFHDLPEHEKTCDQDGATLVEIGRDVSEQLDIVPARIQVIRNIRLKYACPHCQEGVKTAPLPPQPIPKSMASPGMLAFIATSKYVDGLPLYRQESILQRSGIDLPRSTLSGWMMKVGGELVQPIINLLEEKALATGYLQMDETTVQVLKEKTRLATSDSRMWVRRAEVAGGAIILFDYDPSRGREVAVRLLADYQGFLQTDGYEGYTLAGSKPGVTLLGCWAHARRKFDEVIKGLGEKARAAKTGKAHQAMTMIQELYRIEREAKDFSPEQRKTHRDAHARPQLDKIRKWLEDSLKQVPPASALGKAMSYLFNQWPKLVRYLEDGRLHIDNNRVENAIRPFVIGRKGWLFSDSVTGVKASANLYTLVETAKACGLEPFLYLRHLFKQLPACQTADDFEALLPTNLDPTILNPA